MPVTTCCKTYFYTSVCSLPGGGVGNCCLWPSLLLLFFWTWGRVHATNYAIQLKWDTTPPLYHTSPNSPSIIPLLYSTCPYISEPSAALYYTTSSGCVWPPVNQACLYTSMPPLLFMRAPPLCYTPCLHVHICTPANHHHLHAI